MRHIGILFAGALAISGCSAAKAAVGALSPKAPNVTVVNNIDAPRAETVVVVEKQDAPKQQRGFFEKVGIVTTTTLIGAGLGALAGDALDGDVGTSAVVGAAVGGVAGVAIVKD
jgi:hypothetical protein